VTCSRGVRLRAASAKELARVKRKNDCLELRCTPRERSSVEATVPHALSRGGELHGSAGVDGQMTGGRTLRVACNTKVFASASVLREVFQLRAKLGAVGGALV